MYNLVPDGYFILNFRYKEGFCWVEVHDLELSCHVLIYWSSPAHFSFKTQCHLGMSVCFWIIKPVDFQCTCIEFYSVKKAAMKLIFRVNPFRGCFLHRTCTPKIPSSWLILRFAGGASELISPQVYTSHDALVWCQFHAAKITGRSCMRWQQLLPSSPPRPVAALHSACGFTWWECSSKISFLKWTSAAMGVEHDALSAPLLTITKHHTETRGKVGFTY